MWSNVTICWRIVSQMVTNCSLSLYLPPFFFSFFSLFFSFFSSWRTTIGRQRKAGDGQHHENRARLCAKAPRRILKRMKMRCKQARKEKKTVKLFRREKLRPASSDWGYEYTTHPHENRARLCAKAPRRILKRMKKRCKQARKEKRG